MAIRQFPGLIFPVILFLALALAACSSESPTPTQPPAVEPTTAATAAPTEAPTQPATEAPTAEPAATPEPAPTAEPVTKLLEGVRGIVDPSNLGWPRDVEGLNGIVTIPSKPLRIITASIGHDEITLALVPRDRLVGVGGVTKSSTYSNVASLAQDITEISRDPETIVAQSPDVVVTSPFFPAEAIDALFRIGIPVVQTELKQNPEARINSILFMGYIFGEEERALQFAAEVDERHSALVAVTGAAGPRPRVLALTQYSDKLWVAGANSTEGGVITTAGGINAAEEAGIESNQTTSLEGVIAMNPEVIVIAQPIEYGAEEFRQSLLANEALAELPAIKNNKVHIVESKHFTTLSYWNIRGAEDLARLLWPDEFPEPSTASFSLAE